MNMLNAQPSQTNLRSHAASTLIQAYGKGSGGGKSVGKRAVRVSTPLLTQTDAEHAYVNLAAIRGADNKHGPVILYGSTKKIIELTPNQRAAIDWMVARGATTQSRLGGSISTRDEMYAERLDRWL